MRNIKLVTLSRDYEQSVKIIEWESSIKKGKKYS